MELELRFRLDPSRPESPFRFKLMTDVVNTSDPISAAAERPLRADARRNRESILAAARLALAEYGMEVQMDEIAGRAKVGIGTLYRHFPTKESLLGALAAEHFAGLAQRAAAANEAPGSARERLTGLLYGSAERLAADAGHAELMARSSMDVFPFFEQELSELQRHTAALIEQAVADGDLRPDASVNDIGPLMCGLGQVVATGPRMHGDEWRRYLTIMLDGLRYGAPNA